MSREKVKYEGATLFRSDGIEHVAWFNPVPGMRAAQILGKHRMGANDQVGLYRVVIEPQCASKREVHPETQKTMIVISGTAKVILTKIDPIGREEEGMVELTHPPAIQLLQGDVLTIEAGTVHEIRNDARLVPFVFFCIASPPF